MKQQSNRSSGTGGFFKRLNAWVFWPPFLLLLVALTLSLLDEKRFHAFTTAANGWILDHFDGLFSYTAFGMVILCVLVWISPLGKIKIGGAAAVPLFSKGRWFAIVLCTTVAVGILFWGTAEPIFHLYGAPAGLGLEAGSADAARFSMATVMMHWSFTPYAIYAIPALLFALAYYNRKRAFSLGSILFPLQRQPAGIAQRTFIDAICLFALVAGMAAALGAGMLSLSGGISRLTGWSSSSGMLGLVALAIVLTFTISAASGLLKGIRFLSVFNLWVFIALSVVILVVGPTRAIFDSLISGLSAYASNFLPHSLGLGAFEDKGWTHSWTTFYWANWMAWAPVTALFLGRIAYGRTVRQFLLFNWIFPALFGIAWMAIYSGSTLHAEMEQDAGMQAVLNDVGPEAIVYRLFEQMPGSTVLTIVFLLAIFISYVTAADSNTEAMSGLSTAGISPESPDPPVVIKFVWGATIGLVAWVMISYAGIDGVKMLSNLGGLPALFLLLVASIGLLVLVVRSWKSRGKELD